MGVKVVQWACWSAFLAVSHRSNSPGLSTSVKWPLEASRIHRPKWPAVLHRHRTPGWGESWPLHCPPSPITVSSQSHPSLKTPVKQHRTQTGRAWALGTSTSEGTELHRARRRLWFKHTSLTELPMAWQWLVGLSFYPSRKVLSTNSL